MVRKQGSGGQSDIIQYQYSIIDWFVDVANNKRKRNATKHH